MQIAQALKRPLAIEDDAQRRALQFDRIPFSLSDGYKLCSQGAITERGSWLCLMAALKPVDLTLGMKVDKLRSALRVFLKLCILVRPA